MMCMCIATLSRQRADVDTVNNHLKAEREALARFAGVLLSFSSHSTLFSQGKG